MTQRYDHKQVHWDTMFDDWVEQERTVSQMEKEGWELVSTAIYRRKSDHSNITILWFKRPVEAKVVQEDSRRQGGGPGVKL